jgi:hypothetical protein
MAALFSFLDSYAALTAANLTIREAARLAENPLDLRYRAIFPRVPTRSIKISDITTVDFRPIGGRREWNAQGREIPEKLGPAREFQIVPINPTHHIDERMLQLFGESGVEELLRRGVIGSLETWPTRLADATERQLEVEAFEAWYSGLITVMDPKTGETVTVSMGFDQATTYPTAGTIWSDPGQDAYQNFLTALQAAQTKFGSVGAARMRRPVAREITADAPDGPNGLRPTITSLQDRVREEGFPDVLIVIDERTYDAWTDGGNTTTATSYVPAGKIAFQPSNGVVGATHVAPVVRAYDFLSGGNRALANGVVIFRSEKNDGKTLLIEAQENAIVLPDENRTYVVDSSVTS